MRFSKLMAAVLFTPATIGLVTLPGCSTSPSPAETVNLNDTAISRLKVMEDSTPGLADIVKGSYGYAILPEVTKGGIGISVGAGSGVVYRQGGGYWGTCRGTLVDIGVTVGGESYSELLVFNDKVAFDKFLDSGVKLDAGASATALQAGTTAKPNYSNGIAVFVSNTKGFMIDASVGGQDFTTKQAVSDRTTTPPAGQTTQPAM